MKKRIFIISIICCLAIIRCGDDIGQDTSGQSTKTDSDKDGIVDAQDNCPNTANKDQKDTDKDGTGDECDAAPSDASNDTTIPTPTPPSNEGITPQREHLVSPACENDSCFNLTNKQDFLTCSVISCDSVLIAAYLDEGYFSTYDKKNDEKRDFVYPHYADDNKETRKFITGLDVIEDELQEKDSSIKDGSLQEMNSQEIYSLIRTYFTSYDEFISELKNIDTVDVKVTITTIAEDGTETKETKVIDETEDLERHRIITAASSAQDAYPGADESDLYWTLDTYMEGQLDDYVVTQGLPN